MAFVVGLGLWGLACEPPPPEEEEIPVECQDDLVINVGDPTESAKRRGVINLLERHYADGSTTTTVVAAKFGDFTQSTASSQSGFELSGNCVGLSGQPVRSDKHCEYTETACEDNNGCEPDVDCREYDRLDVAGVSIDGLSGGSVVLDQQGVGGFIKAGLSQLYAGAPVDVHITGSTDPHAFVGQSPSLTGIPPPELIEVTEPDITGGVSIGREDLFLRWTEGADPDGIVFIDVVAEHISNLSEGTTRNVKIACAAFDDGCQTLTGTSLQWMLSPEPGWRLGERISVIVGRRSQLTADLSADTPDTELAASLSAELLGEMTP